MESDNSNSVGLIGLAWIVLIVLKALGHLSWGWALTLLFPIWFPIALTLASIAIVLIGVCCLVLLVVVVATILSLCGISID